ncbi:hypothetical protein [Limnohabitans sp. Rim28]|uniref:hypothetical protein n=1 Tax=Limnohabitans sp. Rim28 TaxID=1100720 RepID=UPI0002F0D020|nr:hypothetical protein [Limnohabitans sp. Rim28]PVE09360.1 hypothetical protein B472_00600 [Limnohabitans sp. Rim28]
MFDRAQSLSDQSKRKANLLAQQVLWLVLGLLLSLSGFAANAPSQASQAELSAYKDLQQIKLDALKEAQQKEAEIWKAKAEALDKRIDDQLSQVSRSVDQFGIVAGVLGLLITLVVALAGFFAYKNAKSDAIKAAQGQAASFAKSWFEKHSTDLQEKIQVLEDLAKGHIDAVKDYASQEAQALFAIQQKLGYDHAYIFAAIKNFYTNEKRIAAAPGALLPPDTADPEFETLSSKAREAFEAKRYADAWDYWNLADIKCFQTINYRYIEIRIGLSISHRACYGKGYGLSANEYMGYPPSLAPIYVHELADSHTQDGKLREAIRFYEQAERVVGPHQINSGEFPSKVFWSATISACVLRLLIAKRMAHRDENFQYHDNDVLVALEDGGKLGSSPSNGIAIAIRAYVHQLLGHSSKAERDLQKAFDLTENGGADVRECLGHLLGLYSIPQDQGMRELVDRLWRDFQASNRH